MSFGSLWVSFRNAVEKDVSDAWNAVAPELKVIAISAVESAVSAGVAKGGTLGDQFVAARNAAEQVITASGGTVATTVLHALTAGAVVTANAAAVAPAPAAPAAG